MKKGMTLRCICEGAVMLALAMALNSVKLWRMPNGGSVDLSMIPIFFFAIRGGVGPGLLAGFAFGLLQMFVDGAIAWGWQSMVLDYIAAYIPLGLCGLFRGRRGGIFPGIVLGALLRFAVHFISGVTIYAILVPTELLGMTFVSPWLYSLVYNGSFILIDTALCLAAFALMYRPLNRYILAKDIEAARGMENKH